MSSTLIVEGRLLVQGRLDLPNLARYVQSLVLSRYPWQFRSLLLLALSSGTYRRRRSFGAWGVVHAPKRSRVRRKKAYTMRFGGSVAHTGQPTEARAWVLRDVLILCFELYQGKRELTCSFSGQVKLCIQPVCQCLQQRLRSST